MLWNSKCDSWYRSHKIDAFHESDYSSFRIFFLIHSMCRVTFALLRSFMWIVILFINSFFWRNLDLWSACTMHIYWVIKCYWELDALNSQRENSKHILIMKIIMKWKQEQACNQWMRFEHAIRNNREARNKKGNPRDILRISILQQWDRWPIGPLENRISDV